MILIGIDASITNTAVAFGTDSTVLEVRRFPTAWKVKDFSKVKERVARYEDLTAKICEWLDEQRGSLRIGLAGIEGYAGGRDTRVTIQLAELGGILRFHLTEFCDDILEVNTMTLKKFVGAYVGLKAGPGKTMVIAGISRAFGRTFETDHEFDAFGVYQLTACAAGFAKPKNAAQRTAIDTVLGLKSQKSGAESLADMFTPRPPF